MVANKPFEIVLNMFSTYEKKLPEQMVITYANSTSGIQEAFAVAMTAGYLSF